MSPGASSADDTRAVAPAVFGPEHFEDAEEAAVEGSVLVPTAELSSLGEQAEIQFRRTDTGALALPVYTSVEALVACCGEDQPWLAVTLDALPGIVATAGADGIVQDMPLPEGSGAEWGGN